MLLYTTKLAYYDMHCLLMQAWPPSSATHSQVPMCYILLKHLQSSASHWLYTYYIRCHLMCNCCWFGIQTCSKSSASFLQIPLNWWKETLPDSNKVCMLTLYFIWYEYQPGSSLIHIQFHTNTFSFSMTVLQYSLSSHVPLCSVQRNLPLQSWDSLQQYPLSSQVYTTVLRLVPVLLVFSHCVVMCHCT